jgi:gluconokinase
MIIVVMGVMGCGKSSLAAALAEALNLPFIEGDSLHAPASIAKMAAGIPLTDEDRWPFLDRVAEAILRQRTDGVVASCSALRRRYRDRLRAKVGGEIRFVLPDLSAADLEARLQGRTGHFMPPSMLRSQLETLEIPGPEEQALVVDGRLPTAVQVEAVLAAL